MFQRIKIAIPHSLTDSSGWGKVFSSMKHPRIDFQVSWHSCCHQALGVGNIFVTEQIGCADGDKSGLAS
jgi:hypothetical protein